MTDANQSNSLADIRAILAEMAASQQQSQQRHDSEMAQIRANQQVSIERFSRIEATLDRVAIQQEENNRANAELRQSIADLRQENAEATAELRQSIADLRQENATANAELRRENASAIAEVRQENATAIAEMRQENVTANAELRREIKTNIDDVSAMIFDGLAESKKLTDSNARAIQAWEQRLEAERDETITVEVDTLNAIQTLQSGQDGLRTDVQTLTHCVRDGFSTLSQAIVSLSQELSAQIQNLIDITRDNTGRITRLENEDHH